MRPLTKPLSCFSSAISVCAILLGSSLGGSGCGGDSATPSIVQATLVLQGLTDPVALAHAKEDRLFVVGQHGVVSIVRNGAVLPEPFLDITGLVESSAYEQGLLGLAFHPLYPTTPHFFVVYTAKNTGALTLARFSVGASPNQANPASIKILLAIPHSNATNHNAGQLQFHPGNGYLYWSTGDGGMECDASGAGCNAQRMDLLLGKILRLDVTTNANQPPYFSAPPDNPFPGSGSLTALQWASGLRNPWRFSFDRQPPHDLYIADVGQGDQEEINRQAGNSAGGQNYGWPLTEGKLCRTCPETVASCPIPSASCNSFTAPFYTYSRDDGYVVIGGYVYRGQKIPALQGKYVFADHGSGKVWALDQAGNRTTLLDKFRSITSFGEDKDGELYFVQNSGHLWTLEPAP